MDIDEYQAGALETDMNTLIGGDALLYPVIGLIGEAGELANKIKKIHRDRGGVLSEGDVAALLDEAGDLHWYLAVLIHKLGGRSSDVLRRNREKLASRAARGVIGGNGDYR